MHNCTIPFCIRDLSIGGFWYPATSPLWIRRSDCTSEENWGTEPLKTLPRGQEVTWSWQVAELELNPHSLASEPTLSTTLLHCIFKSQHQYTAHRPSPLTVTFQCAVTLHLWTVAYRINSKFITWASWRLASWYRLLLHTQLLIFPFMYAPVNLPVGGDAFLSSASISLGFCKGWTQTQKPCLLLLLLWHTLFVIRSNTFFPATVLSFPNGTFLLILPDLGQLPPPLWRFPWFSLAVLVSLFLLCSFGTWVMA